MDLLSNEEIYAIIDHLNINDRLSFSSTCYRYKSHVERSLLATVMDILQHFTSNTSLFFQLMWSNNLVIGGPMVLAALFPGEGFMGKKDLHLYVPDYTSRTFTDTLRIQHGYKPKGTYKIKQHHFVKNAVQRVEKYENAKGAIIRIFYSRDQSALTPIFHLSATHNMNFISAYGIYCAYPRLTLSKNTVLHPKALSSFASNDTLGVITERYSSYGFQVHYSFKHLSEDHKCGTDIHCPHITRSLYDKHGLFLAFQHPMTASHHLQNIAYNAEHGVVWSLGGDGCDDSIPRNDAFVVTTWLHGSKSDNYY
jgi:hypothetical protein